MDLDQVLFELLQLEFRDVGIGFWEIQAGNPLLRGCQLSREVTVQHLWGQDDLFLLQQVVQLADAVGLFE